MTSCNWHQYYTSNKRSGDWWCHVEKIRLKSNWRHCMMILMFLPENCLSQIIHRITLKSITLYQRYHIVCFTLFQLISFIISITFQILTKQHIDTKEDRDYIVKLKQDLIKTQKERDDALTLLKEVSSFINFHTVVIVFLRYVLFIYLRHEVKMKIWNSQWLKLDVWKRYMIIWGK
jgi:hypothetical protein